MQVMWAQPNPGHRALAELARRVPVSTVITQNVDDLHERAGSQEVIHLHRTVVGAGLPAMDAPNRGQGRSNKTRKIKLTDD